MDRTLFWPINSYTCTWGWGVVGWYAHGVRLDFHFSSTLSYGMPASSVESQHPEAWPASTYGYLRGVSRYEVINEHKYINISETQTMTNFSNYDGVQTKFTISREGID